MSAGDSKSRCCTRREALIQFAQGALALAVLPSCGGSAYGEGPLRDAGSGPVCPSVRGTEEEGWIALPLSNYPELAQVGGSVVVKEPSKLLDVIVVRISPDCLAALWHICTHGACEVAFSAEHQHVECPCHGSRFALDGAILRGPASQPLPAFPVFVEGDTLWIHRWT